MFGQNFRAAVEDLASIIWLRGRSENYTLKYSLKENRVLSLRYILVVSILYDVNVVVPRIRQISSSIFYRVK